MENKCKERGKKINYLLFKLGSYLALLAIVTLIIKKYPLVDSRWLAVSFGIYLICRYCCDDIEKDITAYDGNTNYPPGHYPKNEFGIPQILKCIFKRKIN